MAQEMCPACRTMRNMRLSTTKRAMTVDGRSKVIRTVSLHCESCGQFVRSEESEAPSERLAASS